MVWQSIEVIVMAIAQKIYNKYTRSMFVFINKLIMKMDVETVRAVAEACKQDKERGWVIDHANGRTDGMELNNPRNLQVMYWSKNIEKGSKKYDDRPEHLKEKWDIIMNGIYSLK